MGPPSTVAPTSDDHRNLSPLDVIWSGIRLDVLRMSDHSSSVHCSTLVLDPLASSLLPGILHDSVLKWSCLQEALAAHLSSKLSSNSAPAERWHSLLLTAFTLGSSKHGEPTQDLIRKDLQAIQERDPACPSLGHAFLYFKGFHGIQVHRAANWLWHNGQKPLASALQSRASEVFGMDIHPAAQIGWGVMIDHATGVVIGETAVVGNGCTLLHAVTLGGTGKEHGDRHPKLGTNVLVGAGASILGNVKIGHGAKIGASALVLTDIPDCATAVGCPAKVIGRAEENPASVLDHTFSLVEVYKKRSLCLCPFRHLNSSKQGFLGPNDFMNQLHDVYGLQIPKREAMQLFFELDTDHDGQLSEAEFNENLNKLAEKVASDQ